MNKFQIRLIFAVIVVVAIFIIYNFLAQSNHHLNNFTLGWINRPNLPLRQSKLSTNSAVYPASQASKKLRSTRHYSTTDNPFEGKNLFQPAAADNEEAMMDST